MTKPITYTLKADVVSHFRGGYLYAAAGEEVKIIAEHGSVWIAEDEDGNRFPVHISKLLDAPAPLPQETKPPAPDKPPPRKSKKLIETQQSLF